MKFYNVKSRSMIYDDGKDWPVDNECIFNSKEAAEKMCDELKARGYEDKLEINEFADLYEEMKEMEDYDFVEALHEIAKGEFGTGIDLKILGEAANRLLDYMMYYQAELNCGEDPDRGSYGRQVLDVKHDFHKKEESNNV